MAWYVAAGAPGVEELMRMSEASFLPVALTANQDGRLTAEQLRHLEGIIARTHDGLAGLVVRHADPMYWDMKKGRVDSVEGAITKDTASLAPGDLTPGIRFEIRMVIGDGHQKIYWTFRSLYDFALQASTARIYYLPRSRWVVNLERLADPEVTDYRQVRGGSREETIARTGAFVRDVESYLPDPEVAATQPPAAGDALVGSWTSPFGTLTFGAGGAFSARLGDGTGHEGRWSLDADGHVHADVEGAPIDAQATVTGDRLTLVMDGQALELRRV